MKYLSCTTIIACIALLVFPPAQSSSAATLGVLHYDSSESDSNNFVRVKRQSFTDNIDDQLSSSQTTTPVVSVVKEDTTEYYDIEYVSQEDGGASQWINLQAGDPNVVKHGSLQQAYRLSVKIDIGFSFLFYGHSLNNVAVATGGFLYMSEFLHSFLTASQYVAPLMANFDTSLAGSESEILFRTDDQAFIAQWNNVYLKDQSQLGKFTFQVQLHREDGKIVAAYKEVPVPIANVSSAEHPVKIGFSDAYYWDVGQYRTIYPYHTYNASVDNVETDSAIIYRHKMTCNMLNNCDDCLLMSPEEFRCYWCSDVNRCSDGFDRQRQDWVSNGCELNVNQTDCDMMLTTHSVQINQTDHDINQTNGDMMFTTHNMQINKTDRDINQMDRDMIFTTHSVQINQTDCDMNQTDCDTTQSPVEDDNPQIHLDSTSERAAGKAVTASLCTIFVLTSLGVLATII